MNKINQIFVRLLNEYGKQGWWPTTLEGELHPTYHGKKINDKQRFEIMVGAILTQNTSWTNVEKAIINLNKAKVLSIEKIRKIDTKKLAELIRPAGYYNQKSERLKIVAEFFYKNKNPTREQLLSVKGIGPETADSILLYAYDIPSFVIDTYTKRIFSRLGVCDKDVKYGDLQQIFHDSLKKDAKLFNEYHALIVEHAKRYCKTKPECKNCPLRKICIYNENKK